MRFRNNETEQLITYKKHLRKNMTHEEVILWQAIRNAQLGKWRIRRQVVIKHYIVDFVCIPAKLVIEIDGSQHYQAQGLAYDIKRTEELNQLGFKVLRFTNHQIKTQLRNVLEDIYLHLNR
ncbi:endonuclease domain-containing protein [Ursidibacter sp. B-7004-1]